MRKTFRLLTPVVLLALPLAAAEPKPAATPKPAAASKADTSAKDEAAAAKPEAKPAEIDPAEKDKIFYSLGQALARNLGQFALTESELKSVVEGLSDGVMNRPAKTKAEVYMPKLQELMKERASAAAVVEKKAGAEFAEKAAAEPGAVKKPSGLIYTEITPGTGESPKASDRVKVHYTGKLTDGTVFDSSVERGQPAEFPLGQVIPCWTEGMQLMKVGGKARFVCPSSIAYGENGAPPRIKPGSTLVFEVELLSIENPPPTPAHIEMPGGHPGMGTTPAEKKPETTQPEKK